MRKKLCQTKSSNDKKMNANKEELPSATTTFEKHGGGRSGSKSYITIIADTSLEILQAVNDMMALTHIDNGKVNDQDMKDIIENTNLLLEQKKIETIVRKMYQRYQKLWTSFCDKNNV